MTNGVRTLTGTVVGLAADSRHRYSKEPRETLTFVAGHGVEGDAHAGLTVRHRSHVARNPHKPNLRQVHLLQSEFFDLAREHGHRLGVGDMGENVTTSGIDLVALPQETRLRLGEHVVLRVTGLRNPCWQIDRLSEGLLKVSVTRGRDGGVVRRTGIMAVVEAAGTVSVRDRIEVVLPPPPHLPLERV